MWDRWVGRSVSLQALSESVKRFFEDKSFPAAMKEESANMFMVIAIPKSTSVFHARVKVSIRGKPDDFVIEFATESSSGIFAAIGSLMTLLGGGLLVKKGLESEESLGKLEKEFWTFIDVTIESLTARNRKD